MASKHALRFQYGKGKDGLWYWHLRARNGEIISEGEGYKTKRGALKVYRLISTWVAVLEPVGKF